MKLRVQVRKESGLSRRHGTQKGQNRMTKTAFRFNNKSVLAVSGPLFITSILAWVFRHIGSQSHREWKEPSGPEPTHNP